MKRKGCVKSMLHEAAFSNLQRDLLAKEVKDNFFSIMTTYKQPRLMLGRGVQLERVRNLEGWGVAQFYLTVKG